MNGADGDGSWGGMLAPPAGSAQLPGAAEAIKSAASRLVREPLGRRARRERGYAALSFLLAFPGLVIVAVAIAGAALTLSLVGLVAGIPLLAVALRGARWLAGLDRALAWRLLGTSVPRPAPLQGRGPAGWMLAPLTDGACWRALAYLVLKLVPVTVATSCGSFVVLYGIPYLSFPLWWQVLHLLADRGFVIPVPHWLAWWNADPLVVAYSVRTFAGSFALIPAGALALLTSPWLTRAANAGDAALITGLLGRASLPRRVADLERSRARVVDDSAARLREIERDLHDGAQAQLVAVAMKLGLAREKLGAAGGWPAPADLARAVELIEDAHRGAKEAILELRDLARGIHPPALDHGLGTALETLAAGSVLAVELCVELTERPSAAIETIAYFCAAELLANVAKHSRAGSATLAVAPDAGLLRIKVTDYGAGGAQLRAGGGLSGLAERARTVDGALEISSPSGGPTTVTVELPMHA